jgi:hypothetical protein
VPPRRAPLCALENKGFVFAPDNIATYPQASQQQMMVADNQPTINPDPLNQKQISHFMQPVMQPNMQLKLIFCNFSLKSLFYAIFMIADIL